MAEGDKIKYGPMRYIGWYVVLALSIIPVFLLIFLGPGFSGKSDYRSVTHLFGQLFGLIGMTMFSLTFVLSTRMKKLENWFGGLDKVYLAHGIIGGSALILILAHPIFLVLRFIPEQIGIAAGYFIPSPIWAINFGIIALIGMILLVYLTLYSKLKYHNWKFTHEFMGLMFIIAVFHIVTVRGTVSQDYIFKGYYWYAGIVAAIGIMAFVYSLLIRHRVSSSEYKVSRVGKNNHFFMIEMVPEKESIPYQSGQFVFVKFYNKELSSEAHPFSIASRSGARTMRIVVKKLGDFTNKLDHLKIGDRVSIEGPYGKFNFKNFRSKNQIWIGAGVGITPFIGMAEELENSPDTKTSLFYTVKNDSDFVGSALFSNIMKKTDRFNFVPWDSSKKGRIKVDNIEKMSGNLRDKEFLICGPSSFKESIIGQLLEKGVKREHIHEEAFDLR